MLKKDFIKQTKWQWNQIKKVWDLLIAKVCWDYDSRKIVNINDFDKVSNRDINKKYIIESFDNIHNLRDFIKNK